MEKPEKAVKKLWARARSQAWWEECADPSFPADEFQRMFRVSRETFCLICDKIGPLLIRQNTRIRAPVPVQQRVASGEGLPKPASWQSAVQAPVARFCSRGYAHVTGNHNVMVDACVCARFVWWPPLSMHPGLWRLASADALYLVSRRFGLGVSTCQKTSLDMCTALNSLLLPEYVQWPSGEYLNTVTQGFEQICGVPKVAGVLYTTHISICAPRSALAEYHNKRHTKRFKRPSYSMTIQATVDHRGLFTDLCLGWPGSMTDEKILEKSALSQRANQGALQGHWVIGGRSVPLKDWLLVPYPDSEDMSWMQRNFNERLGDALAVAKNAFTRLKARWRFLTKRTESKLGDLPTIFGACCVLHNICERQGEIFDVSWGQDVFDDFVQAVRGDEESPYAMQERDRIAHMLLQSGQGYYQSHPDAMDAEELLA